jgi:hypothetical protein
VLEGEPDCGPVGAGQCRAYDRLFRALADAPASTRALHDWFEHYRRTSRDTGERLVSHPRLFLDAQRAGGRRAGERLRDGPEGECATDLRDIEAILAGLRKRVAAPRPLPLTQIDALLRLGAGVEALINEIQREGVHGPDRNPSHGAHPVGTRSQPARDQPHLGDIASHCPAFRQR